MNTLEITKEGTDNFWHVHNNLPNTRFAISDFQASLDGNKFNIIQNDGAVRYIYLVENITIIDNTNLGNPETFVSPDVFWSRLKSLGYTAFLNEGFSPTFSTTDNLPEGAVNKYFTSPRVLGTVLNSYNEAITGEVDATDTILTAFSKISNSLDNKRIIKTISLNEVGGVNNNVVFVSNQIETYTISETELLSIKVLVIDSLGNIVRVELYDTYNVGKGIYGNEGIQLTSANFSIPIIANVTAQDYQDLPTTETIVIDNLGGLNVAQFVNAKNPFYVVKAISEGRTLFATPSGIYLFKLAGGNYGVGGITTTTLADYELLSETATPPTIDAEVIENSTNAVSGGGVFDFVQPTLEKEVPIITDSFTILDSVDSKRKKLTFDNLINYVKVFFDQSLENFKTINFLDATSSIQTQINSKQVKDSQIEVNGSTNVSNAWNGKTILVTASCTITIPATLLDQFMFVGRTLAGVTLTIAITAPFTFETVPTTITEKKTFSLIRRGSTNTILLDF
jgi:hypothetical protein